MSRALSSNLVSVIEGTVSHTSIWFEKGLSELVDLFFFIQSSQGQANLGSPCFVWFSKSFTPGSRPKQ